MSTSTAGVDGLDPLIKLWIRLWSLVLDKKRHYETVRALLQRLVYESGWPTYKNWPEICKIGRTDRLMMMVLSTIDMSRTDPTTAQIIAAFPQCFSDKEVKGPVPWSMLLVAAEHDAGQNDSPTTTRQMRIWGTINRFGLPYQIFYFPINGPGEGNLNTEDLTDPQGYNFGALPLPPEIHDDSEVGSVVEWNGRKFVVIENIGDPQCSVAIVPAECIALDL